MIHRLCEITVWLGVFADPNLEGTLPKAAQLEPGPQQLDRIGGGRGPPATGVRGQAGLALPFKVKRRSMALAL